MPDDEKIAEAMALAMCEAAGYHPTVDRAKKYIRRARRQLAAHRAMIKAEKEIGE